MDKIFGYEIGLFWIPRYATWNEGWSFKFWRLRVRVRRMIIQREI